MYAACNKYFAMHTDTFNAILEKSILGKIVTLHLCEQVLQACIAVPLCRHILLLQ